MCFGSMGLFRWIAARERFWVRYLSDASYWLYLTHLPLVIAAQILVVTWSMSIHLKFLLISTDDRRRSAGRLPGGRALHRDRDGDERAAHPPRGGGRPPHGVPPGSRRLNHAGRVRQVTVCSPPGIDARALLEPRMHRACPAAAAGRIVRRRTGASSGRFRDEKRAGDVPVERSERRPVRARQLEKMGVRRPRRPMAPLREPIGRPIVGQEGVVRTEAAQHAGQRIAGFVHRHPSRRTLNGHANEPEFGNRGCEQPGCFLFPGCRRSTVPSAHGRRDRTTPRRRGR